MPDGGRLAVAACRLITGGQRVDMFGAPLHQLPDIREKLIGAGSESGHAYGKAPRTVKSCVGTTWWRLQRRRPPPGVRAGRVEGAGRPYQRSERPDGQVDYFVERQAPGL